MMAIRYGYRMVLGGDIVMGCFNWAFLTEFFYFICKSNLLLMESIFMQSFLVILLKLCT